MGGIRVKRLTPADTTELLAAGGLFDDPPEEEAARSFLSEETSVLLLGYVGDEVVGFVRGTTLPQPHTMRRQMFLYEIGVAPEAQRGGVGTALMNALADIARETDCEEMFVFTNRSNEAGMRLYERTGGATEADDEQMFVYYFGS